MGVQEVRDGAEALDYLRCEGAFAGDRHGGPVVVLLDLKLPKLNGLEVLRGVDGISFTFFTARDVVRHPLVAKIVRAYDARDQQDSETGPA